MFRILIIDDDAATRSLLQRTLQKQGYEVFVAGNGRVGLEQARQLQPALIVCDWMMPEMDGLQVCREIKSDPALSTTFFVLLTTRGATQDRVVGLDTGADDFLSKPIELEELRARVRAGLRIHQLTQDLQSKNQDLKQLTEDLQRQKQALDAELVEASEYVRSLLPAPLTGPLTINTRFIPSSQLGGDGFDYYWLDPDFLAIYLIDVAGHGVGATLLSVSVLNVLRSQSLPGVNFYQPAHVLSGLNDTFQMQEQHDKYFTIWYGVYNRASHQLTYASAGHPPALLITHHDSEPSVKRLKTPGLPIGMLPEVQYTNGYCRVESLSTLYIFSDGIYDVRQHGGQEMWGLNNFVELVTEKLTHQPQDPDQVLAAVQAANPQALFEDDVSLIQLTIPKAATPKPTQSQPITKPIGL